MPRTEFPSDAQDQYMVRFPEGMRDRLKQMAGINNRSMNAEIVERLAYTFPGGRLDEELAEQQKEKESLVLQLATAKAEASVLADKLQALEDRHFEFFDLEIERERQRQERRVLDELRKSVMWPDRGETPDARPVVVTLMRALLPDADQEMRRYAQFRGSEFLSGVPVDRIGALKGLDAVTSQAEEGDADYQRSLHAGVRKYQEESASYVAAFLKRLGWKVSPPKGRE